jgi:hypothetical protein
VRRCRGRLCHYAIRLKANAVLERQIGHLLTRPVGRPPNHPQRFYHSFQYQAQSWSRPRRVVTKIEWRQDELFPRVGFIVTNLGGRATTVVSFCGDLLRPRASKAAADACKHDFRVIFWADRGGVGRNGIDGRAGMCHIGI